MIVPTNHKVLAALLRKAGHKVVIPGDAGLSKADDPVHLEYARQNKLILLTKNLKDFLDLHLKNPDHSGIFAIYQDNDPRDMKHGEIVQAIANLGSADIELAGAFHILNNWRYRTFFQ